MKNAIKQLALADPELAGTVLERLKQKERPVPSGLADMLVDETLWGLSKEIGFGYAVAEGYAKLIQEVDSGDIYLYRGMIRDAGLRGPTFGKIMATYLAQVLLYGNRDLLEKFLCAVKIMFNKGEYLLNSPLACLSKLLESGDLESADAFCDLLSDIFVQNLSYNKCRHFSNSIPKAVLAFSESGRMWKIRELRRIVQQDPFLADKFLEGIEKGLYLLSQNALNRFVSIGLKKNKKNSKLGKKFLSLESRTGIDACFELQIAISLDDIRHQLNSYLQARTGLLVSVRSFADLPELLRSDPAEEVFVCSDGKFIYLPEELGTFSSRDENLKLYKALTKLEAGYYEFGTFDFDLEKFRDMCGISVSNLKNGHDNLSDLELFFLSFQVKNLAADLFTIIEHARLNALLKNSYPGLIKRILPLLQAEAQRRFRKAGYDSPLLLIYALIALDMPYDQFISAESVPAVQMALLPCFQEEKFIQIDCVEESVKLVTEIYGEVEQFLKDRMVKDGPATGGLEDFYQPMQIPFGRRIRPELFFAKHLNFEKNAAKIKLLLQENGFKAYKSEIRKQLVNNNGALSVNDIEEILISSDIVHKHGAIDLSGINLEKLIGKADINFIRPDDFSGSIAKYPEWDYSLGDYLQDHVQVRSQIISGSESDLYDNILKQHQGLVQMIRYSFELLKPESLKILRQWIEGDEFDYRALLDFAIDKKVGLIPDDRLYIKRIKQERDVAVLLLVDLSRSTAHRVTGSNKSVLDVEKEAIVLFCEALDVIGDSFAIAGFSGTGRFGVDYYTVKAFDECMGAEIKNRISALASQRSTRMGAAIRHAVCWLEKISSKVRLLLIIGDGFPNDIGYKHKYAIEDTRKAMLEARSKNIYAKAITVNIPGDPMLDELYGETHHNVISDISELPDKLLQIYRSLTSV